jgi:hypothetical protein
MMTDYPKHHLDKPICLSPRLVETPNYLIGISPLNNEPSCDSTRPSVFARPPNPQAALVLRGIPGPGGIRFHAQ